MKTIYAGMKGKRLFLVPVLLGACLSAAFLFFRGPSQLRNSIEAGHARTLDQLLGDRPSLANTRLFLWSDRSHTHWVSPLVFGILQEDAEVVRVLLDHGADPDEYHDTMSPLCFSVLYNTQTNITSMLVCAGAHVDGRCGRSGNTALACAASEGKTDFMRTLMALGAGVDVTNRWGQTPLMLAAQAGHTNVLALLIRRGVDISAQSSPAAHSLNALAFAAGQGHVGAVQVLLKNGSPGVSNAIRKAKEELASSPMISSHAKEDFERILELLHAADVSQD